jgi:hypothetical protein
MSRAVEQRALNSMAQDAGMAALSGVRRKLSGLHGNVRADRRPARGGRALAGTPTPPQARAVSLLALGAECAKFLEKWAANIGHFAQRGGVARFSPATKDVPGPAGGGSAALGGGVQL